MLNKKNLILWMLKGLEKDTLRRRLVIWKVKKIGDKYMDGKSWYKSKSVWTAILGVALGAVQPVSTALGHPVVIPTWAYEVLGGFGVYA